MDATPSSSPRPSPTAARRRADAAASALYRRHSSEMIVHGLAIAAVGPLNSCAHIMSRSEEHTSELQSLMRSSYAVLCWKKKKYSNDMTMNNNLDHEFTKQHTLEAQPDTTT